MRPGVISMLILLLATLISGCDEVPDERSQNISAILSPDSSRIAFARSFRYFFKKATVLDPGGFEETVFEETSIYTIDPSAEELTKLAKTGENSFICGRYDCQVNISWENDIIAYIVRNTIYIIDSYGNSIGSLDLSREKFGPAIPFTLSGDASRIFYLGMQPEVGLYSINLDGKDKTFIGEMQRADIFEIHDMLWDSTHDVILVVNRPFDNGKPTVWEVTLDGNWSEPSERGLMEYRRRRLGGWESNPPFSELENLTKGISHAEWDIPEPDEFD